jgi:hypothetical protein
MAQQDTINEAGLIPQPRLPLAGGEIADSPARGPRLSPDDRAALGMWAAAHLALLALAWAAAWAFHGTNAHAPLTGDFQQWDANYLQNIAQYGYFSPHSTAHSIAFFPGFPITLAAAHLVVRNWILSELIVSGVAGCFAVVALARLAGDRRAVLYLLVLPAAVFLTVGYAESEFLAFAIPAWLAGTRGNWRRAAILAGMAGLVRPDGLFLIPALAVMALAGPGGSRLRPALTACCGLAGPAAYEGYLIARTGAVKAWSYALQAGWDQHLVTPVQALKMTWWAAFRHPFSAAYGFEFQLELAAMAAICLATIVFAGQRRWPEATYCGLAAIGLGTATWYQSCPRTLLLLFPVWISLARLGARRPWIHYCYLALSAPLASVVGLMFLYGQWAG